MPRPDDPPTPAAKVRILLVAANPSDTTRIAVGEEYREIDARIRASKCGDRFELTFVHELRAGELAQVLQRHEPDVVHFSGHGSANGELLLPDAVGRATPADPEAVATIFEILSRDHAIRCVLLNACYSETLANALAEHVDCVIGMPSAVKDKAAIAFAGAFYEALGFGRDVDAAYRLACAQVDLVLPSHGALPNLHTRSGIKADALRLVGRPRAIVSENDPHGLIGQLLDGKYKVESVVGRGGFGVVYRGTHDILKRPVAIKLLRARGEHDALSPGAFAEAFVKEAQTIAQLDHPAIVRLIDFAVGALPDGSTAPWMILEWVDGETLAAQLEKRRGHGGRPPSEVLALVKPVFEALGLAHASAIVHRDVKPANIMLPATGEGTGAASAVRSRILDFGIAKVMKPDESAGLGLTETRSDFVACSLPYAAPEQVSGTRTGPWTDVHALALVVTEALVDLAPYPGRDRGEVTADVMSPTRPTPARFGVDVGEWEPVLARALSMTATERFANATDFLHALEASLPGARHDGQAALAQTAARDEPKLAQSTLRPQVGGAPIAASRRSPVAWIAAAVVIVSTSLAMWRSYTSSHVATAPVERDGASIVNTPTLRTNSPADAGLTARDDASADAPTAAPLVDTRAEVTRVSVGGQTLCVHLVGGHVMCVGDAVGPANGLGVISGLESVIALSAGGNCHACAVVEGGGVRCWGRGDDGDTGAGPEHRGYGVVEVPGVAHAIAVATGQTHSCALLDDGQIRCWGRNREAQLGDGTDVSRETAAAATGLGPAVEVAAGGYFTCARMRDGTAACWGANSNHQVSERDDNPITRPVAVPGLSGIVQLVAAHEYACAVRDDGSVWCWGQFNAGDGSRVEARPVEIAGLHDVVELAAGTDHLCARLRSHSVVCLGNNSRGQLGVAGARPGRAVRVASVGAVSSLAASWQTTCVVQLGGAVMCWGALPFTRIVAGRGSDWSPSPVVVPRLPVSDNARTN